MILVITGMDPFQFDRVIRAIDDLAGAKRLFTDVFIQLGACTYVPQHCAYERFLSFADVSERIRAAEVVITHAGAGSTLNCIHNGKHPVLIPRLARFGEVVDDHQIPFAERLDRAGTATLVMDLADLAGAIDRARLKTGSTQGAASPGVTKALQSIWTDLHKRP